MIDSRVMWYGARITGVFLSGVDGRHGCGGGMGMIQQTWACSDWLGVVVDGTFPVFPLFPNNCNGQRRIVLRSLRTLPLE